MADHPNKFSSDISLKSSSDAEIRKVLEHVSSQDLYDTIRNIDKRYKNIANNLVQVYKFLLTNTEEDQFLTISMKKGVFRLLCSNNPS